MPSTRSRTMLRTALQVDALSSGALGALLVLAGGAMAAPLQLPEPLLRGAGIALIPFSALVAYLGTRVIVSRGATAAIIVVNLLWVAGSILLLVGNVVSPAPLGVAFVVVQALAVLAFAEAQIMGLRRTRRMAAAAAP